MTPTRANNGREARCWRGLLAVLLLTGACVEAGEIYRWVDETGAVHFGDRPPRTAEPERLEVRVPSLGGPPVVEQLERFLEGRGIPPPDRDRRRVTIYTTPDCPHCRRAKAYFAEQGIPYLERDIETSVAARQAFARLGGRGVPLILVGHRKLHGFSPASFSRVYAER